MKLIAGFLVAAVLAVGGITASADPSVSPVPIPTDIQPTGGVPTGPVEQEPTDFGVTDANAKPEPAPESDDRAADLGPGGRVRQLLPLALSVNTIAVMWLAGSRRTLGWWLGLFGQAGWAAFIVLLGAWGLTPLCLALTVVYARNLIRWRRQDALAHHSASE